MDGITKQFYPSLREHVEMMEKLGKQDQKENRVPKDQVDHKDPLVSSVPLVDQECKVPMDHLVVKEHQDHEVKMESEGKMGYPEKSVLMDLKDLLVLLVHLELKVCLDAKDPVD